MNAPLLVSFRKLARDLTERKLILFKNHPLVSAAVMIDFF